MGGLFDYDSKLFQLLLRVSDLVALSLLWLLCSHHHWRFDLGTVLHSNEASASEREQHYFDVFPCVQGKYQIVASCDPVATCDRLCVGGGFQPVGR